MVRGVASDHQRRKRGAGPKLVDTSVRCRKQTFPKSIQIVTRVPKDLCPVSADPTQLYQVLLNLCLNARDAMPGGGMVTISAQNTVVDEHIAETHIGAVRGSYVMVSVSD